MVLRDPLAQRGARPRVHRRRLQRRAERRGLGLDRAGDAHVEGICDDLPPQGRLRASAHQSHLLEVRGQAVLLHDLVTGLEREGGSL